MDNTPEIVKNGASRPSMIDKDSLYEDNIRLKGIIKELNSETHKYKIQYQMAKV